MQQSRAFIIFPLIKPKVAYLKEGINNPGLIMLSLDVETGDRREYLLDMIEQLADLAREIGEIEVAIHLDATAEARRHTLDKPYKED